MKKTVIVDAPAKINLFLDIQGKRTDGYHLLRSVMQTVDLCDTLTLSHMSGKGIYISCSRARIPCDENNLAHMAARKFFETFDVSEDFALSIDLEKRIPIQAGLGGGSTDAAAVLVGLNEMFEVHAPYEKLCEIGVQVGADVPFCIIGGTHLVTGIGEELMKLKLLPECHIVLARPMRGMNTADAFRRYDEFSNPPRANETELLKDFEDGNLLGIATQMQNALETACPVPEVGLIKARMLQYGALGATMTGSGSAVLAIFDNRQLAKRCMRKLYELSESVFLVRPIDKGAMITRMEEI